MCIRDRDNTIFAYGGMEVMTEENIKAVYGIPVAVEKYRNIPIVIPL